MLKIIVLLLIAFSCNPLWGWYYPEHAVITDEALKKLPSPFKKVLEKEYKIFAKYNQVEGYQLCHDLSTPFYDESKKEQENCIPYSSWAAMAADHSTDVTELKAQMKQTDGNQSLGLQLVKGGQDHWRFVLGRMKQEKEKNKKISDGERRNLIRRLDIFLTLTDPNYLTRARGGVTHFSPGDDNIEKVLKELVEKGRSNNSVNQFIIHHLRSLQYATLARKSKEKRNEYLWVAYLEHGFATHFFQDAFAAGHIIMFDPYLTGESDYSRLMRHDYFNRNGVPVTRLLTPISCSYSRLMKHAKYLPDYDKICWTTYGDGFMGKGDGTDLKRAAYGNTLVQAQFAMALSPKSFKKYTNIKYCKKHKVETHNLLKEINAFPDWTIPAENKDERSWTCKERTLVIKGVLAAIESLGKYKKIKEIDANSNNPNPGILPKGTITDPIKGCVKIDKWNIPKETVNETARYCPSGEALYLGNAGTSLLRPYLSAWPISQSDKAGFFGSDPFETGFNWQFGITTPFLYRFGDFKRAQFGLNFQAGVSYRLQHVLASDPNFGVAELWAGLYPSAVFAFDKAWPVTMLTIDFRTMVPTLAFSALFRKLIYALFIKDKPSYGSVVSQFDVSLYLFSGFRWYWQLKDPRAERLLGGWDLEIINLSFPLNDTILGIERFARIPTQVRLRMGSDTYQDAFTIGVEFSFGVSRPF